MGNLFATSKGRLSVAAIAVVPLLYSAAYLGAFWNPYGHLNRIPVAVVNQDHGSVSQRFVDQLKKDFVVKIYRATGARHALTSGRVGMTLTIPPTFSQAVTHHKKAPLSFVTDPGTNYLTSILMQREAQAAAADLSQTLRTRTLAGVRAGISRLSAALTAESQDTGRLSHGAAALSDQRIKLAAAGRQAASGAAQLASGLKAWQVSASAVSGSLASSSSRAAAVSTTLARSAKALGSDNFAWSRTLTVLRSNSDALEYGLAQATHTASKTDQSTASLASLAQHNAALSQQLQKLLQEEAAAPSPQILSTIESVAHEQSQLAGLLASGTSALASGAGSLHTRIQTMAQGQAQLTQGIQHAALQSQSMGTAAVSWAASAGQWTQSTQLLNQGARSLRALAGGTQRLRQGARTLQGGLHHLDAALSLYGSGVSHLAGGLQRLGPAIRLSASLAPQLSAPLENAAAPVTSHIATTVNSSYGTGMAPYFLGLSLWVGAVVATVLVPGGRYRKEALGARTAQSLGIAGLQVLLLGVGTAVVLPIHPAHPVLYGLSLVGIGVVWWAAIRFLVEKFGDAGRVMGIALLVIQLAGAGGTYPVLLSPGFFQALHPYLPMTWAIELLRWTLSDGYPHAALTNAMRLGGLGTAALILVRIVPIQWLFDAPTLRDDDAESSETQPKAKMA